MRSIDPSVGAIAAVYARANEKFIRNRIRVNTEVADLRSEPFFLSRQELVVET